MYTLSLATKSFWKTKIWWNISR